MRTRPLISAVICTYNREQFIRSSLECLARQTLDKDDYEVIVIDNHSTDRTAVIVREFIEQHPHLHFRSVFEENKGLSFARNRGISEASSGIITYIDDDAEAVPGFLEAIVSFFSRHPQAQGIGGRVIPAYPGGQEPGWMNRYLNGFVGRVDFGDAPRKYSDEMKYPAGCNMSYTRNILRQAGGFNNRLTFRSDDKYIFFQVRQLTDEIYYLPEATVYHHIDAGRLEFDNFRKLFLKTGNEEKVRIRSEGNSLAMAGKFLELVFKMGASLLLYLVFLLRKQEIKGRYLVFAQWFTLKGFLKSSVFVR